MDSSNSRLTNLQQDIIRELASHGSDFFLTGGAVLVGWLLQHRTTDDIDVFTSLDSAMERVDSLARRIAEETQCNIESLQAMPDHRRYLLSRQDESVRIDFVHDRAPQLYSKPIRDGIRTDSIEEILVNKICALVGRSEIRDIVDLMYLEKAGYRIEEFIDDAIKKDSGITPAILAWVLSTVRIPDSIPGDLERDEVVAFVQQLEKRMRMLAKP